MPIIRTDRTDRGYEVWCGGEILKRKLNSQVRMEFEIETKKSKGSNLFSVYLVYPTRGLEISFNYEGTELKNVRDVGYFSGKNPYPEVTREEGKSVRLSMGGDDWIFPTSGVTFIWQ